MTSWRTLMACEESLNKFLNPDPERRGCYFLGNNINSIGAIVSELRPQTDRQTDRPKYISITLLSSSDGNYHRSRMRLGVIRQGESAEVSDSETTER